jgi:hypothetical protein
MKRQCFALAASAWALAVASPSAGQVPVAGTQGATPAAEPAAAPAATGECCSIPAMTLVEIELADTVNSKANAIGDHFAFRLARPLEIDGRVVVPAGTPGVGEVVHAARARAGGKAGELILAARYLDLNGQHIPLRSFRYGPSQGKDNSGAVNVGAMVAAATIPGVAMLGYLVAGGEVNVPAGTRANAKVAVETRVPAAP